MADQDSKKERREAAREARRKAEQEAAAAAAKARVRSILITVVSLVVIGGLVWLAIDNNRSVALEDAVLVNAEAAQQASTAAGCEVLAQDEPLDDRTHFDPATAPPGDALYGGQIRPAHSGPHFSSTHPIIRSGSSQQLEERAVLHSMEHGSVGFFYDPDKLDGSSVSALDTLAETYNDSGFAVTRAGAGIFVAPYTNPGISSGKALAMRAWGQAVDCDTYDEDVALSFIIEHYGTHGIAPEGNFAPYPEDVLRYDDESDQAVDEDSPQESNNEDPSGDLGTMAPSDDASDTTSDAETTSDDPSADPSAAPSADPTAESSEG